MSRQITQKNIQSLVRIQTRTRSQRLWGGTRLRRLTQALQPSSQCPTGADRHIQIQTLFQLHVGVSVHESLDKLLTQDCFFCLSRSNPPSTRYTRINREGARPWGLVTWGQVRSWRMSWSRHTYHISCTLWESPGSRSFMSLLYLVVFLPLLQFLDNLIMVWCVSVTSLTPPGCSSGLVFGDDVVLSRANVPHLLTVYVNLDD